MTPTYTEPFDFEFLRQQINEGLIVEDEMALARIAILVPDLYAALVRCLDGAQGAERALLRARAVVEGGAHPA